MKVLVIGGMHGNERLGIEIVRLLKDRPIEGVSAIIGNPIAVKNRVRYVESDMNRSFNAEVPHTMEEERAIYIKELVKDYDLVLDFHNTETPKNNTSFAGTDPSLFLRCAISFLGIESMIEATYDCINKFCPNTVSIEISIGDVLDDAMYWYKQVKKLAEENIIDQSPVNIATYRYLQRITWQQQSDNGFAWSAFKPLTPKDQRALRVAGTIVPIFVGSTLTQYYATLVKLREPIALVQKRK